jgi:hypothetical protein
MLLMLGDHVSPSIQSQSYSQWFPSLWAPVEVPSSLVTCNRHWHKQAVTVRSQTLYTNFSTPRYKRWHGATVTLKCQWRLCGGPMCTICHSCTSYQNQNNVLGIRVYYLIFCTPFVLREVNGRSTCPSIHIKKTTSPWSLEMDKRNSSKLCITECFSHICNKDHRSL